jgi:hypothetical protein
LGGGWVVGARELAVCFRQGELLLVGEKNTPEEGFYTQADSGSNDI